MRMVRFPFSNTVGIFATNVKVAAFKCGQVVAEVFRDVAVGIASCGTLPNGLLNSPPIISSLLVLKIGLLILTPLLVCQHMKLQLLLVI